MTELLFVCTANICRSPMAAAIFKKVSVLIDNETNWIVGSAGTWTVDDMPATENAVAVLGEMGLDLSEHRSTDVTKLDLQQYDLIVTMEQGHKEAIIVENPEIADRIYILSEMIDAGYDIPDPIGGNIQDFRDTVELIEDILTRGYLKIKSLSLKSE